MARKQLNHTIPKGWKYDLLDTFTNRRSGHTPSQSYPEYWNGGIKWVSLADSSQLDNGFIYDTVKEISNLGLDNSSAELHPENTVIMARDAGIGKSAILFSEMAVSQHFIAWRCSPETISSWFLYNWLQFYKIEFERQAVGSTIKTIGLPFFKKLKIALPPIQEQQKIAEILSTWDKAIASTENLIANSEIQKKALMQQLLTGKKRLLDENGVRFSGEWEKYTLKNISNTFNGLTGKTKEDFGEGSLFITYMNIYANPGISTFTNCDRVKVLPNEKQHIVKRGDVFFTTSSETPEEVGLSSVLLKDPDEPIYLNSFSFGIRFNDNIYIKPEFSQFLFRSPSSRKQISALAQGSTRFNLSKTNFMKLSFNIPIQNEQGKIAEVLSNADREIELLKEKLGHLQQEKKALMQQLLTGKRRVTIN